MIPPLGNSLLTSNGTQHAWQRKMLTPSFSYAHLKEMVPFMKTAADDLVKVRRFLGSSTLLKPAFLTSAGFSLIFQGAKSTFF